MADTRGLPMLRWGEELRRHKARRRSWVRIAGLAVAALSASALAATLPWPPRPLLLWNGSESAAVGLYHVEAAGGLAPGQTVIAWAPGPARRIAAERGYLPLGAPLVKRIAAARGDRVCAIGEAVFINGRLIARRLFADASGRPLPWWTGCVDLERGDVFLLMPDAAGSFDGRYFGVTRRDEVIGEARLIWPR